MADVPATSNAKNLIVLNDHLGISNRYFYVSKAQNKAKVRNISHKVSYIKLNGFRGLIKFL